LKIYYGRVSKEEEKQQDPEAHKKAVFEKFDLYKEDVYMFEERGSAYDLDKFHKRKEFIDLMRYLFKSNKVTIEDLFLRNFKELEDVSIYIWDYSRLMRNMEYCLFFAILSCLFRVKIYSCKDGLMSVEVKETPSQKLGKYMLSAIYSYSGEEYSYNISKNVKKAVNKDGKITISKDGNKWGRKLKATDGTNVSIETQKKINKVIISLIEDYEVRKVAGYYPKIIKFIEEKYKIKVSKYYINRVKNIYIKV